MTSLMRRFPSLFKWTPWMVSGALADAYNCVLGAKVVTNLFPNEPFLGRKVRVGTAVFEVIGTLAPQGHFLGAFSLDNRVILPVQQLAAHFWGEPGCLIQVKARSPAQLDETKEELRGVLRKIRRVPATDEDDFAINQQETLITSFHRVAATIAAVGLPPVR